MRTKFQKLSEEHDAAISRARHDRDANRAEIDELQSALRQEHHESKKSHLELALSSEEVSHALKGPH